MKNMVHQVDIMSPPTSLSDDNRGQEEGVDTVYMPGVPCSIEMLTSREQEAARQVYSSATYKVKMYGEPGKPITNRHWLKWLDGSKYGRRLEIGSAIDVNMNGEKWELTCGEGTS